MKKHLSGFLLGFILSFGTAAYAQGNNNLSQALATSYQFCWDQAAADLTTANSYVYRISNDNAPEVQQTVTCSGTVSPFQCQVTTSTLLTTIGSHTFKITANVVLLDGSTLSSTVSAAGSYNIVDKPLPPGNPHIKKIGTLVLASIMGIVLAIHWL